MRCLTDEQIAIYLDQRRADPGYNLIREHLNNCDSCLSRMTSVYDDMKYPCSAADSTDIPQMPRPSARVIRHGIFFKVRYILPAAAAAAAVFFVIYLSFVAPVRVDEHKMISDDKTIDDVKKNMHNRPGVFSIKIPGRTIGLMRKDLGIFSFDASVQSAVPLYGSSEGDNKKERTVEERLARERRFMLIKCGYIYFILKQSGDVSGLDSWSILLEVCFPGLELKDLSGEKTAKFENGIISGDSADREDFIRGFVLAYYIYTVRSGEAVVGAELQELVHTYLKNEKLLRIDEMVAAEGDNRTACAERISGYFVK